MYSIAACYFNYFPSNMDTLSPSSSSARVLQPKLSCQICSAPFAYEPTLQRHLRTDHNLIYKFTTPRPRKSVAKPQPSTIHHSTFNSKFKCYICGITFETSVCLSKHLKNYHQIKLMCTDCNHMFNETEYFSHIKIGCPQKVNPESSPLKITKVVSLSSLQSTQFTSLTQSDNSQVDLIGCVICAFSDLPLQAIPQFSSSTELEQHKVVFHPEHLISTHFPPFDELNLNEFQFKNYCRALLQSEVEFSLKSGSLCPYCQIKRSFLESKRSDFVEHLVTCHVNILVDKLKVKLDIKRKKGETEQFTDINNKDVKIETEVIDLVNSEDED